MWKLANAVGYQLVWFISVVGAAHDMPYAGPLAAIAFVLTALAYGGTARDDLRLIPFVLVIGLLFDSGLIALGWLHFSAPWPSERFSPLWMLGVWLAFALTLNHSMAFLKGRYALAATLGAIGGPLAYWSASHGLGAITFDAPAATVSIGLGAVWCVLFPCLVRIAERPHASATQVVLP